MSGCNSKCPPRRPYPQNKPQKPSWPAPQGAPAGGENPVAKAIEAQAAALEANGDRRQALALRQGLRGMLAACMLVSAQPAAAAAMQTEREPEDAACDGHCLAARVASSWPAAVETINCAYRQPDITDCVKDHIIDEESEGQLEIVASPDPLRPGWYVFDIPTPRMASMLSLDALRVTGINGGGDEADFTAQVLNVTARSVFTIQEDGVTQLAYGKKAVASGAKLRILEGRCACRDLRVKQTAYHVVQVSLKLTAPQPSAPVTVFLDYERTWAEDCENADGTFGAPLYDCGIPDKCGQTIFVPAPGQRNAACPDLPTLIQQTILDNPGEPGEAAAALKKALDNTGFAGEGVENVALFAELAVFFEAANMPIPGIVDDLVAAGYDLSAILAAAFAVTPYEQQVQALADLAETFDDAGDIRQIELVNLIVAFLTVGEKALLAGAVGADQPYFGQKISADLTMDGMSDAECEAFLVTYAASRGGTFSADLKAALP